LWFGQYSSKQLHALIRSSSSSDIFRDLEEAIALATGAMVELAVNIPSGKGNGVVSQRRDLSTGDNEDKSQP
jgi:hypothetical protein